MSGCRVLLADDHTLVRAGIRSLLQEIEGVEIVGEAASGREALALARDSRPSLVVMDISMAELNGIDAAIRIRAELPNTKVLMLSMHTAADFVRRALAAGATGYLVKDSAPLELTLAVQAVMRGEVFVSSRVSGALLPWARDGSSPRAPESLDAITPRQREILQMIAEGRATKEIAFRLEISIKTVETHRAAIMKRLSIRDTAGLVIYAVRNNLVGLERPGS